MKLCHSLTSGGTFNAWSEFGYFRHVEEVVSCGTGGNPVGQLGDPLGRIQAAGIYLKSYLGLLPCLGEALSIEKPSRRSYCDPCHGGIPTLLFAQV